MTTGFDYIFDSLFPSRKRALSTIELPAEEDILVMLEEMANEEKYSVEELGGMIFRQAVIEHYRTKNKNLRRWEELTDRQKEVAAMVCLGATNAEIAQELEISLTTVKTHMREVLRKLNAAKGGGYIFQSDHSVANDVSGQTYDMIVKLVREFGSYPLALGEFDEAMP